MERRCCSKEATASIEKKKATLKEEEGCGR
jgi:hypothetical protein